MAMSTRTPGQSNWLRWWLNTNSGYTLVEVVMVLAVLALVLTATLGLLQVGVNAWGRGELQVEAQQHLRIGLDRLARELRQATTINAGASDATHLSFQLPRVADPLTLDTIRYYYDTGGQQLLREVNGAGNNPVAQYLTGVNFSYAPDFRLVGISLTAQAAGKTTVLTTQVHPRGID